jgi:hypothetical protein
VADLFEATTLQCLCLALPRSSKSPELVKLLRSNAFQLGPPDDALRKEREETVTASLNYIEVSSDSPQSSHVTVLIPWLIERLRAAL